VVVAVWLPSASCSSMDLMPDGSGCAGLSVTCTKVLFALQPRPEATAASAIAMTLKFFTASPVASRATGRIEEHGGASACRGYGKTLLVPKCEPGAVLPPMVKAAAPAPTATTPTAVHSHHFL
jgi:hypothetical protein